MTSTRSWRRSPPWEKPAGTIRITTAKAAETILWPVLAALPDYPTSRWSSDRLWLTECGQRYDAAFGSASRCEGHDPGAHRPGDAMAVVGLLRKEAGAEDAHDLADHACINLRLPTSAV